MNDHNTIFAVSTAPGRAGIAILRISGPAARGALEKLGVPLPRPRMATLASPGGVDQALVLWFPAPGSFTGEDLAELHVHGSPAVLKALVGLLTALPGLRLAEPGEFARRAFANGKLDLAEIEGLADLIDAETEAQRKQALRALNGENSRRFEELRAQAVRALAHLEAYIDFPDEDLPPHVMDGIRAEVAALEKTLISLLGDGARGERIREGINIIILGAPNAGKSSLLNALAKRDAAIVSPTPGTTRDMIEAHLDIGGYPAVLVDTAGLRESTDPVEMEGIRRARARAEAADIKLLLLDGSRLPGVDHETLKLRAKGDLVLISKADIAKPPLPVDTIAVPTLTPGGLDALHAALEGALRSRLEGSVGEAPLITRHRHRAALENALTHLERFKTAPALEFACEELRLAAVAIGKITGKVEVDELLERIFKDFCIGK